MFYIPIPNILLKSFLNELTTYKFVIRQFSQTTIRCITNIYFMCNFFTGMLVCNGKVLKPVAKKCRFERESDFYASLISAEDECLKELKKHVPKYYGIETITINDKKLDCIILEDLTKDMKEPCIMDIKIGKRTWDPMASYEKIMKEEVSCKNFYCLFTK